MFRQPADYLKVSRSENLLIRPLSMDDVGEWTHFYINNPSLIFFPFLPEGTNELKANKWIARQLERYANNEFGLMALVDRKSNKLRGQCGLLTQTLDDRKVLEIGYHVIPEYWGQGIATEAAKHFKAYAWQNKISKELVSIIHKDNISSQKVATKNGMKKVSSTQFHGIPVDVYQVNLQSR